MNARRIITILSILLIVLLVLVFLMNMGSWDASEEPHRDEPTSDSSAGNTTQDVHGGTLTDEISTAEDSGTDKDVSKENQATEETQANNPEESTVGTDAPIEEETSVPQQDKAESNETEPTHMPDKGENGTEWI